MNWPPRLELEPPSFAEQCAAKGWEHGFFWDITRPTLVFHINPAITRYRDKAFYAVRLIDWKGVRCPADFHNQTLIGELDLASMKHGPLKGIGYPLRHPVEQHEDARLISTSFGLFTSMAPWVPWKGGQRSPFMQVLGELDENLQIKSLRQHAFGGNMEEFNHRDQKPEKNWMWFEAEPGHLSILYHHTPHTVIPLRDFKPHGPVYRTHPPEMPKFGELRCSTPPVQWNGLWLTFAHCATQWGAPYFIPAHMIIPRYSVRAILFEPEPPFEVSFHTGPILVGSLRSHNRCPHGPAVFASGCIVEGDTAILSCGINDMVSAWCKIPLNSLPWLEHRLP